MVTQTVLHHYLNFNDWLIFFVVLLTTFLSVWWGQRIKKNLPEKQQHNTLELLLMGRKLTLPLFVPTLVATWYGGIFGVTALTYEKGIYNFLTQGIFWYISYLIFAFFLVKKIRSHNVMTIPEMARKIFGLKAEKLTAALNFLNLLPIAYTISLGLFLKSLFGGSLLMNTFSGVLVVSIWSLWGGFRAVVYSDIVQFFFMMLSVFLVVMFSWFKFGPPTELLTQLPPTHLDWSGGENLSSILIWGFIALSSLVDPNFYQRVLAADSDKTAKKGIILSTIIWSIFDCLTTLGALYAFVALPGENSHEAYLKYSIQLVPHGVRGLILAGILAIILSTIDSYLFNAATCMSYDLFNKKLHFKKWHHHTGLIFVAILSVVFGIQFKGNVIEVWKTLGSFSAACLLFPLMISQWKPGIITEKRFCWSVISGCVGIVSWKILGYFFTLPSIDEFYIGLILTTAPLFPALLKKDVLPFSY